MQGVRGYVRPKASWRSGYAEDCKSLHPGSIPGEASNWFFKYLFSMIFQGFGARLFRRSLHKMIFCHRKNLPSKSHWLLALLPMAIKRF
jgi:hypothetical protein